MYDLNSFQRDLLYAIEGLGGTGTRELPHGLYIREALSDYYEEEINHGRLYPNLDTLVEKGLVSKEAVDRRTNGYKLTDRGRWEIQDRRQWENEFIDLVEGDPLDEMAADD